MKIGLSVAGGTMQLTAEHFSQLLGTLEIPEDSTDSRRQPRVQLDAQASLIPLAYEATHDVSVTIRDLSSSGIGFLHDRRVALDEQFALMLPQQDDSPAILLCTVVFWEPLRADLFKIGARFVRVLRDAATPLPIQVLPATVEHASLAVRQQQHRNAS